MLNHNLGARNGEGAGGGGQNFQTSSPDAVQLDGSIYDKKYPNPKKLLQKVFQRFSVVFDILNNILKI